jgi:hypothetical protein
MKHLVLAVVILMALATAAGATTVCTGLITSGEDCTIGGFKIIWDGVLPSTGGTVSAATSLSGNQLSIDFTLHKGATVDFTITPPPTYGLYSSKLGVTPNAYFVTAEIMTVTPSTDIQLNNNDFTLDRLAPGAAFSVSDGFTGPNTGNFGATNTFTFMATPEPASVLLIGCGLVGIGFMRRRRS